jgi:hypothetical protein
MSSGKCGLMSVTHQLNNSFQKGEEGVDKQAKRVGANQRNETKHSPPKIIVTFIS